MSANCSQVSAAMQNGPEYFYTCVWTSNNGERLAMQAAYKFVQQCRMDHSIFIQVFGLVTTESV